MILNENSDKKIIPVAGGKGGVGKSVLAANIALSMALNGKKTVLVDLDLGGSNLHTILGIKNSNPGIGNYISGRKYSIEDITYPTEWENLYFIPGDSLVAGISELTRAVKKKIIQGLLNIDADYVFIDLGGGSNFTVIDFFLISNSGLIVATPQTTSIMNSYSFIKNYVFRFLQRAFAGDKEISKYLKKAAKEKSPGERLTVSRIIEDIKEINNGAAEKAEAFLEVLQPKLILNKVERVEDIALAEGLRDLTLNNLSINLECLGTVMNDKLIDHSINLQRPYIIDSADSVTAQEINRIAVKIIQSRHFPEMPLELEYYSDSFELAQIETENDLAGMQNESSPAETTDQRYDTEQLLELIRVQQTRIQELQSTLRILSMNQS